MTAAFEGVRAAPTALDRRRRGRHAWGERGRMGMAAVFEGVRSVLPRQRSARCRRWRAMGSMSASLFLDKYTEDVEDMEDTENTENKNNDKENTMNKEHEKIKEYPELTVSTPAHTRHSRWPVGV